MGVYFCFLCFLSYLHSRDKEMPMTRVYFFMFICTINETWAFYRVTCNHPKKVSKNVSSPRLPIGHGSQLQATTSSNNENQ